ncbi:hypothetical protein ACFSHP_21350 [Novosphingobium panipatense]
MARGAGLRIRFAAQDALTSTGDRFPLVVELHSGEVAVVTAVDEAGTFRSSWVARAVCRMSFRWRS